MHTKGEGDKTLSNTLPVKLSGSTHSKSFLRFRLRFHQSFVGFDFVTVFHIFCVFIANGCVSILFYLNILFHYFFFSFALFQRVLILFAIVFHSFFYFLFLWLLFFYCNLCHSNACETINYCLCIDVARSICVTAFSICKFEKISFPPNKTKARERNITHVYLENERRSFYFRIAFFADWCTSLSWLSRTFLSCLKCKTPQRVSFAGNRFHTLIHTNTTSIVRFSVPCFVSRYGCV